MKVKALKNGEYVDVEIEENKQQETVSMSETEALNEFFNTLASSDTNSIAKIRAAAQNFIDNTSEI